MTPIAAAALDVKRNWLLDNTLCLYLPLWDSRLKGSPITSQDIYRNSGTVTGALWTPQGRSFNGSTDYIDLGNSTVLRITGTMTLEGWVKLSAVGANPVAVVAWGGAIWAGMRYMLWADSSVGNRWGSHFGNGTTDYNQVTKTGLTNITGVWWHVVATWDGVSLNILYLNGSYANSSNYAITITTYNANPLVGKRGAEAYFLNGVIGEVRIYDRVLSPAEIQQAYNDTKWRYQ